MNRREWLTRAGLVAGGAFSLRSPPVFADSPSSTRQVLPLRIRQIQAEVAPGVTVPALVCNDRLSGPLIWVDPNRRVDLEVTNESAQAVRIRGAGIAPDWRLAPGERRRTCFDSPPSGLACPTVSAGEADGNPLVGVFGTFARLTPVLDADQTHFLTIHHWLPSLTPGAGARLQSGVTYQYASLGDRLIGADEPIRVREGQHVRFHFFNASPTKSVHLALPGHRFLVSELDGYAVACPRLVEQVALGPGERLGALVHMTTPGRFVLGSIDRRDRNAGFGRVVEYPNARGAALHPDIASPIWDYSLFGDATPRANGDASCLSLEFSPAERSRVKSHRLRLTAGKRYRLRLVNATGERQCVALRDHAFRLTKVAGASIAGVIKDTVALSTFAATDIEFDARLPEVELLHASGVTVSQSNGHTHTPTFS